jgi:hypothetical protein
MILKFGQIIEHDLNPRLSVKIYYLKLVYLTVYIISRYLNFLKDVQALTSYIPLNAPTLNSNH